MIFQKKWNILERKKSNKILKIFYKHLFNEKVLLDRILFAVEDYTNLKKYYQKALNDQFELKLFKDIYPIQDKKNLGVQLKRAIEISLHFFEEFTTYSEEKYSKEYLENQMN